MSALTSLLARDGVVPVRKIEEALQRQVISGGDVETVLLELDALPENVLNAYCALLHGLPALTREDFDDVPPEVLELVPAKVAKQYRVVPLARDGDTLTVAVAQPVEAEAAERIGFVLGLQLDPRIACPPRIAAALARYYDAPLAPRLERLLRNVEKRISGIPPDQSRRTPKHLESHRSQIPVKAPPVRDGAYAPGPGRPALAPDAPPAETVRPAPTETLRPEPPLAGLPAPAVPASSGGGLPASTTPAPPPIDAPIPPAAALPRVDPSGDPPSPDERSEETMTTALGGEPALPEPRGSVQPSAPSQAQAPLLTTRGPITLAAATRALRRADDRDHILGVLFSYARQFFDYTALFVVHDGVVDGRDAYGKGANRHEVQQLSIPLEHPGVFQEVARSLAPRVRRLDESPLDRELLRDLKRPGDPPAFVMPIAIRRRVVVIVYGDRDGESFDLGAVMELVRFGPRVVEAFEQLILRRKRAGYRRPSDDEGDDGDTPGDRSALKEAAQAVARTAGSDRPAGRPRRGGGWGGGALGDTWSEGGRSARRRSVERRPERTDLPAVTEEMETVPGEPAPSLPQRPPDVIASRVVVAGFPGGEGQASGRVERTAEAPVPPEQVLGIPRRAPSPPPSPALGGGADDGEGAEPQLILAGPDESLQIGADDPDLEPIDGPDVDDAPEITVVTAPEGTGVEGDLGFLDDDMDFDTPPVARPIPGPIEPRAPEPTADRAGDGYSVTMVTEHDAGGANGEGRPTEPGGELIRLPVGAPAARRTLTSLDAATRSVIVDMGDQVHAKVDELLGAAGSEAEGERVKELLELGEAALPGLVQAFPGPLKYDRHGEGKVPRGRDVSAVARALVAFGERAVPYVASLLSSAHPDVRFYAALVASELIHPGLMEAVADRIFDDDPGVRRVANALLPRFRAFPGFEDILAILRRTARLRGKSRARRLRAVDALAALRDVESLPKLVELLQEEDGELVDHLHRALIVLTAADVGRSHRKWEGWLARHGNQHRIEWLIEGLLDDAESIRHAASEELKRLTREYYGYHAASPRRDRERVYARYKHWWQTEGQQRFAGDRPSAPG
ncbi:MAG: hypothetical protein ACFCGT_09515 [Sandaracinaceae bacterium]